MSSDEDEEAHVEKSDQETGGHNTADLSSTTRCKRRLDGGGARDIPSSSTDDLPGWVAGASPAKFVSMDELMGMSVAMENMALVHEIAINPEFNVPEKRANPIARAVEECMKKAYWDALRADFSREPPEYSHALLLFADIKKMILDLLLPYHVRLRSEVECMLDLDLLKQQVEKKCLDIQQLFENIVELLSRLCAPIRTELINDLRMKTDTIDRMQGICELLDVMKLDMVNFCVQISRPILEKHSSEYERIHFMKFLEKNPGLELSVMNWLRRHVNNGSDEPSAKKRFEDLNNNEVSGIISNAYMELLEWNPENPYPETLKIDCTRLKALAQRYFQLIVCTCSVLISCNLVGKDVAQITDFKTNLKNDVIVITDDIDRSNVTNQLEKIAVLCDDRASQCCKKLNIYWTKERSDELKEQILQIGNSENHVRELIRNRMRNFILLMLTNPSTSHQQQFPPGLSMIDAELSTLTAQFARITDHNRQTFGTYYGKLIKKLMDE